MTSNHNQSEKIRIFISIGCTFLFYLSLFFGRSNLIQPTVTFRLFETFRMYCQQLLFLCWDLKFLNAAEILFLLTEFFIRYILFIIFKKSWLIFVLAILDWTKNLFYFLGKISKKIFSKWNLFGIFHFFVIFNLLLIMFDLIQIKHLKSTVCDYLEHLLESLQ